MIETQSTGLAIRPLLRGDIPRLERELPFEDVCPGKYYEYYSLQQSGAGVSLTGWQGVRPIAHALVCWRGPVREPMASSLKRCAHLSAFHVHPDCRSRGVGTDLLKWTESVVRARGYRHIGLSVDVDNSRARLLYDRLGYVDAGFAPFAHRWSYTDPSGVRHGHEEVCIYLVKVLGVRC